MAKKQLGRSVSIIGVGITKFGDVDVTPELKDMTLQDMMAWACMEAMEDAGVNPQQIDKLIVGQVCAVNGNSQSIAPNFGMTEWVGMRGKPSAHQSEACATPFDAFNEAVLEVASGRYDIAMATVADSARHIVEPNKPSHKFVPSNRYGELYGHEWPGGATCQNTAWDRYTGGTYTAFDQIGRHYIDDNGLTDEEYASAINGQSITAREHGALNPKAFATQKWQDIAKARGFDDVNDFFTSKYNPPLSEYLRPSSWMMLSEGAAAIIVCATEIADQFKQMPVEVVNLAQVDLSVTNANPTMDMNELAAKEIYEITGYKPEDIDYFQTTDGDLTDALSSAEACGYLPKGEGWKYFRDGETRFDGKKPMNTDGGHQTFGHAFGATGLATIGESVYQMREQAGARQITPAPKTSMMRGWGAGQSVTTYIFKALPEVTPKGGFDIGHYDPQGYVKKWYDGLEEGKFLGMKCPKCGAVEFPLYPGCNTCGNVENEIIELSGDCTIEKIYKVAPLFVTPEYAMYAPLFGGEITLAEGPKTNALIFGITPENYEELKNSTPLPGKLCTLQKNGYKTFAVSYNGVLPAVSDKDGDTSVYEKLLHGELGKENQDDAATDAPATNDNPLSGHYAVVGQMMGAEREMPMDLVVDGETITGKLTIMDQEVGINSGSLKGNKFTMEVTMRGMDVTLEGTLKDGHLEGTADIQGMTMELEGDKQ